MKMQQAGKEPAAYCAMAWLAALAIFCGFVLIWLR